MLVHAEGFDGQVGDSIIMLVRMKLRNEVKRSVREILLHAKKLSIFKIWTAKLWQFFAGRLTNLSEVSNQYQSIIQFNNFNIFVNGLHMEAVCCYLTSAKQICFHSYLDDSKHWLSYLNAFVSSTFSHQKYLCIDFNI